MRIFLLILASLLFVLPVSARKRDVKNADSLSVAGDSVAFVADSVEKGSVNPRTIFTWNYKGPLAFKEDVEIDSSMTNFYVNNPAYKRTIALQTLGNMGSPAQSAIFIDRKQRTDFIFFQPYQIYYRSPEDITYFNTKVPFSYINYYSGTKNNRDARRLDGLFTVNVNKRFNFGLYGDWTKAYGFYSSESTKNYNAGYFMSYDGLHSQFGASVSFNGYESYESGGFTEDENITDPKNTGHMESTTIPVYFTDNDWTKVRNWNAAFNYRYNFGIEKEVQVTPDSTTTEIIPVTSIIYKFSSESDWRRFYEQAAISGGFSVDSFYHSYNLNDAKNYNTVSSCDSSRFFQMKQTIGVSLNEEYNTLMKFGLAAYASLTVNKYTYLDENKSLATGEVSPHNDSLGYTMNPAYNTVRRNKFGVGAILSKHQGPVFTYQFYGEYYFLDEKKTASSFEVGGKLDSRANWGKQPVEIGASVKFERYCPDFYEDYYFSNHVKWSNDFENKQDFIVNGFLSFPTFAFYNGLGLKFSADFRNLNNYVYWNKNAMPQQYDQNLQVLTFAVKERARVWHLHWDNELVFQQTSESEVLPLPTLSWFSSAYLRFDKLFKVLDISLGVDMRWNSAYNAPNYMPATGQFFVQDANSSNYTKYGDYVYMDAFLNFQLKRVRFYVAYNHFNALWMNKYNYLYMRGYAMDPSYFKFGLSAMFAR